MLLPQAKKEPLSYQIWKQSSLNASSMTQISLSTNEGSVYQVSVERFQGPLALQQESRIRDKRASKSCFKKGLMGGERERLGQIDAELQAQMYLVYFCTMTMKLSPPAPPDPKSFFPFQSGPKGSKGANCNILCYPYWGKLRLTIASDHKLLLKQT